MVYKVNDYFFSFVEKFDVKDRGILFTLKNPPRFNDAKMYWNLRDLLINSFEIKFPSLTFNRFVENILVEIQGTKSNTFLIVSCIKFVYNLNR